MNPQSLQGPSGMKPKACTCAEPVCICELWECERCEAQFSNQPPIFACPVCGHEAIGPPEPHTDYSSEKPNG